MTTNQPLDPSSPGLTQPAPDVPQRSGSFQAVVRAGDAVVAYLRTGAGKPVLLLRGPDPDALLWATLLERIAERFRVLVPESPPDPASLAEWFSAFHDGLGLGAVRVVADASFGVPALRMALMHTERVDRLVVLTDGPGDDVDGELTAAVALPPQGRVAGSASHPVLFVPKLAPPHEVAVRVVAYLQGQSAPVG